MAEQKESFHAYLIYAWHYADCEKRGSFTNHSHALVSYDRLWLDRMFKRIKGSGYRIVDVSPALNMSELEQIVLEREASRLIQSRKNLEHFNG